MHSMVTIATFKVAKKVNLNSSLQKKNKIFVTSYGNGW